MRKSNTDPFTRTLILSEDDVKEIIVRYFQVPHGNIIFDQTIGKWKVKIYEYKYQRIADWKEIKEAEESILE